MRVRFSAAFAEARGSAGSITASAWKGIPYLRSRITPANPKTDLQVAHRLLLTKSVAWWHDLEQQLIDSIDALVTGTPMSGFNAFCKRNVKDLHDVVAPRILPLNAITNPIQNLAGVPGTATKTIDLTWVQGEAVPSNKMYILAGEATGDGVAPANLVMIEKDTSSPILEALTITLGKASTWYMVAALVEEATDHVFSIASTTWAQSKA